MGKRHLAERGRPSARTPVAVQMGAVCAFLAVSTGILGVAGGLVTTAGGLVFGALFSVAPVVPVRALDGRVRFEEELERARRFGHALTLVRVPNAGCAAMSHVAPPVGSSSLARRIDLVWMEGEDLYLTLYDTRADGAAIVLDRLQRSGIHHSGALVSVFPNSALTAGAMLQQVTKIPVVVVSQPPPLPALAFDVPSPGIV